MKKLALVLALGLTLTIKGQQITNTFINEIEYKLGDTLHIGKGSNSGEYLDIEGTVLLQPSKILPITSGRRIIIKQMFIRKDYRNITSVYVKTKISNGFTYYFFLGKAIRSREIVK